MVVNSYMCYWLAGLLSRALPRRVCYWLAVQISGWFYRFDKAGSAAVRANLRTILAARGHRVDEQTLADYSRRTFSNFGKYLVDFFRYSYLSVTDVGKLIVVEHPEYIQEALGYGKGVLTVSAHLGNWELGGAAVAALGFQMTAVVLPQRLNRVNRLFQKHRTRRGFAVIPLGQAASGVLRALKRGEFVGLLADVDFTAHHATARLFGRPAHFPRGAAFLAVRTGAPILPGFVIRRPDDRFVLRLYPPISAGSGASQEEIQARLCAVLEDVIGAYPDQWFVFRDFWGGAAEGVASNVRAAEAYTAPAAVCAAVAPGPQSGDGR